MIKNPIRARYKSYRSGDKAKGRWNDLETTWAYRRMASSCYFCNAFPAGGLDRIDNALGHSLVNTVSCCENCNFILCDIPWQAKLELKWGLAMIHGSGLLKEWVIPTKRRTRS